MRKLAKAAVILSFLTSVIGLAGGFYGALHPLGDSLAVFRLYALAGLLFSLIGFWIWRKRLLAVLALLIFAYGAFSLRNQLISPEPVEGLSLVQLNLQFSNDARQLAEYAKANAPDIITLQEVTTDSIPQLAKLRPEYPYQVICPFASVGGVAILSKYRFSGRPGQGCNEGLGLVSARVALPKGDVTVASLHLYWPFPYGQSRHLEELLPLLEALERPVIVAGDFNMVPWGTPVERVGAATGTRVIAGLRFSKSLFGGVAQLPIDHVLLPIGWRGSAIAGPKLGSDHNAILAQFAP